VRELKLIEGDRSSDYLTFTTLRYFRRGW